jgi:hypothetical protein
MSKLKQKKLQVKNVATLDIKHQEKLSKFEFGRKSLPSKVKRLKELEEDLDTLEQLAGPSKYETNDIKKRAVLKDNIGKLQTEIERIENSQDELKYFMDTMDILVNYYEPSGDNSSEEQYEVAEVTQSSMKLGQKVDILSFFNTTPVVASIVVVQSKIILTERPVERPQESKGDSNLEAGKKQNKALLYDRYRGITDETYRKKSEISFCTRCPHCDLDQILNQQDGCFVCQDCGNVEPLLIESEKRNYRDQTQDNNTYAYKRSNHLNELLSQIQAKESTEIPLEVYDKIIKEIRKRKIRKDDIDIFKMRRILKKLELYKYYEHVSHIIYKINGRKPPVFSREIEEKVRQMFRDIQKPFEMFCPSYRKNFLSYSYVLHKFFELLELDEYLVYFPLLKNNKKLKQQDRIWEKICGHMKWQYIPSI